MGPGSTKASVDARTFRSGTFWAPIVKIPLITLSQFFAPIPAHPDGRLSMVLLLAAYAGEIAFLWSATTGAWRLAAHASDGLRKGLRIAVVAHFTAPLLAVVAALLARYAAVRLSAMSAILQCLPDGVGVCTAAVAWSLAPTSRRVRVGSLILALVAVADVVLVTVASLDAQNGVRSALFVGGVPVWILLLLVLTWLAASLERERD